MNKETTKMETIRIALKDLEQNTGQIPGLPANPRQWTKAEVERIARSLQETPELFEARPIIVTRFAGKFVILGGNLRFEGCKRNKDKDAPCYIIPDDTPIEKMREIIIKDNGSFGEWDFDALANLWDDLSLADWGVPAWENPSSASEEKKDISDQLGVAYKLEITCTNEAEQEKMYNELIERGFECRILTL